MVDRFVIDESVADDIDSSVNISFGSSYEFCPFPNSDHSQLDCIGEENWNSSDQDTSSSNSYTTDSEEVVAQPKLDPDHYLIQNLENRLTRRSNSDKKESVQELSKELENLELPERRSKILSKHLSTLQLNKRTPATMIEDLNFIIKPKMKKKSISSLNKNIFKSPSLEKSNEKLSSHLKKFLKLSTNEEKDNLKNILNNLQSDDPFTIINECNSLSQELLISQDLFLLKSLPINNISNLLKNVVLKTTNPELLSAILNLFEAIISCEYFDLSFLSSISEAAIKKLNDPSVFDSYESILRFVSTSYFYCDKEIDSKTIKNLVESIPSANAFCQNYILKILSLHVNGFESNFGDEATKLSNVIKVFSVIQFDSISDQVFESLCDILTKYFDFYGSAFNFSEESIDEFVKNFISIITNISNAQIKIEYFDTLFYSCIETLESMNEEISQKILLSSDFLSFLNLEKNYDKMPPEFLLKFILAFDKKNSVSSVEELYKQFCNLCPKNFLKLKSNDVKVSFLEMFYLQCFYFLGIHEFQFKFSFFNEFKRVNFISKIMQINGHNLNTIKISSRSAIRNLKNHSSCFLVLFETLSNLILKITDISDLSQSIQFILKMFDSPNIDFSKYQNSMKNIIEHLLCQNNTEIHLMLCKLFLSLSRISPNFTVNLFKEHKINETFSEYLVKPISVAKFDPNSLYISKKLSVHFCSLPFKLFEQDLSSLIKQDKVPNEKKEALNRIFNQDSNFSNSINEVSDILSQCNFSLKDFADPLFLDNFRKYLLKLKTKNYIFQFFQLLLNLSCTAKNQDISVLYFIIQQLCKCIDFSSEQKLSNLNSDAFSKISKCSISISLECSNIIDSRLNSILRKPIKCKLSLLDSFNTIIRIIHSTLKKRYKEKPSGNFEWLKSRDIKGKYFIMIDNKLVPEFSFVLLALMLSKSSDLKKINLFGDLNALKKICLNPIKIHYVPKELTKSFKIDQLNFYVPGDFSCCKIFAWDNFKFSKISSKALNCLKYFHDFTSSLDYEQSKSIDQFYNSSIFHNLYYNIFLNPIFVLVSLAPQNLFDFLIKYKHAFGLNMRLKLFSQLLQGFSQNFQNQPLSLSFSPKVSKEIYTVDREDIQKALKSIFTRNYKQYLGKQLEIEFLDEVGTGIGPTLEFYANASEFFKNRNIWMPKINLLHPLPENFTSINNFEHEETFSMMGGFCAKAFIDHRLFNINISIPFLKRLIDEPVFFDDLKYIDEEIYSSILQLDDVNDIETLEISFIDPILSLPLIENGENLLVNNSNLNFYKEKLIDFYFGQKTDFAVNKFKEGFSLFCSPNLLKLFNSKELFNSFCDNTKSNHLTVENLSKFVSFGTSFSSYNSVVINFFNYVAKSPKEKQMRLIKFITGATRLPIDGLGGLNPPLTITKRDSSNPDKDLPSVMTCMNYLKIPEYSTAEVLEEKFDKCLEFCLDSFHLS